MRITRCSGNLMSLLENDLALERDARQHVLLEEYHIVRLQSEIMMAAEEIFGRLHGVFTRHNVPKTDRHVKTYRNY